MGGIVLGRVGVVRSSRDAVVDDDWDREEVWVEVDVSFGAESLNGLSEFSHVEVVYLMDRVDEAKVISGARHPRNNTAWPAVGIFAQRAKNRPNRIGTTVCRILKVDGLNLHVEGLDAVNGSPVLDIKPWVKEFGPRGEVHQPAWITELMARYWE